LDALTDVSQEPDARNRLLAEAGLVFMVVIWGVNFAVVKWALEAFEPLGFNALRHVLAALFMYGALRAREGAGLPRREDVPRVLLLGAGWYTLYQLGFMFGLDRTRAGNAAVMLALVPLFLLLLSGRSAVPRPAAAWAGAVLSVLGVTLVSGSALQLEGSETLLGDVILIGAAGAWAFYTFGAQPLIERYGPIRTTAWTLWAGSVAVFLIGVPSLVRQDWSVVTAPAWGGLLFSGLMSIGVAYLLWYRGVQKLGGAHTAVFSNLTPVVALAAGALWLGEHLTVFSIAGVLMVIGGVMMVRVRPRVARV
jgi:drug/metabolite transporter (DMT)-like permease